MESSHFSWHVPFTSAVYRCNRDLKSRARRTRATNVHLKVPMLLSGENPTLMQYLQMTHYLLKAMNSSLGKIEETDRYKQRIKNKTQTMRNLTCSACKAS